MSHEATGSLLGIWSLTSHLIGEFGLLSAIFIISRLFGVQILRILVTHEIPLWDEDIRIFVLRKYSQMLRANGIVGALGFTLHELKRINPALGLQIGTSCFNMIFRIA